MAIVLNNFLGGWNPIDNTPALQDGVGTVGDYYIVLPQVIALSVPPGEVKPFYNRDLGSGSQSWVTNFHVYYDGSTWQQMEFTGGAGTVPNLQQVATVGNTSTLPLYAIGYGANTTQVGSIPYTASETDFTLLCDCSFADTDITLPTVNSISPVRAGRIFAVKNIRGPFRVNITVDGGGNIDSVPIVKLANVNDSVIVQLNAISGQEYNILAGYP